MGAGWVAGWVLAGMLSAAPKPQVVSALEKVRPGKAVKGSSKARLSLARGECEAAQVVLPPGTSRVQVKPLALRGPGKPLEASVWREAYVNVETPSNGQGATGLWPDALVPVEAPPTPGAPAVLYVELCAPEAQSPGTYRGSLRVEADGKPLAPVPFQAEVQPFVLPATASLPTSFGISLYSIARGHGLKPDSEEARALLRAYGRELLAHRLSAHGMSMDAPPVRFEKGRAVVDFRAYDAEMAPFLEGEVLPSGARFTTADVRDSRQALTDEEKVAYYRAFAEHFRKKGWKAQLFFYAKDEPKPEDVPLVRVQAKRVRAADKGVPVLVTAPLDDTLRDSADILAPVLNCFFPRPGPQTCRNVVPLAKLRGKLAPHVKVWWYQSCNSHGCNGGPAEEPEIDRVYSGWASYMVDHPATLNRAMGPLAFSSGVDGELYFDTVFAYNTKDPWKDIFEFGGNGDGTLFYPGTPERLGGAAHQPVASLRLKHLRDGLEDYEYLQLLTRLGEGEFARACVRRLVRSGYDIERKGAVWEQVRRDMTARIKARWAKSEFARGAAVTP
jgi:Domain of unknown function (DUF4091)